MVVSDVLNEPTERTETTMADKKETPAVTLADLDEFTVQFLETALWATGVSDRDGNCLGNLDDYIDTDDLSPETLAQAVEDCDAFRESAGDLLDDIDDSQAGHDFFLTREGHGAGFWDRGLGETGQRLTELSRPFGDFDFSERFDEYGEGDSE